MADRSVYDENPITLDEMIEVAGREAGRIRVSQEALVVAGLRPVPHAEFIRDAEKFEAIARFLERCKPHMKEIRAILTRRR